jgi:hypothetical protein
MKPLRAAHRADLKALRLLREQRVRQVLKALRLLTIWAGRKAHLVEHLVKALLKTTKS